MDEPKRTKLIGRMVGNTVNITGGTGNLKGQFVSGFFKLT